MAWQGISWLADLLVARLQASQPRYQEAHAKQSMTFTVVAAGVRCYGMHVVC